MVRFKDVVLQADTMISLGQMRSYLAEWFENLNEEVIKTSYQDYSKALIIKNDKNENVFYAPFEASENISDKSEVFLSGIVSDELRSIIRKCIELDGQIAEANKPRQNIIENQPIKIG